MWSSLLIVAPLSCPGATESKLQCIISGGHQTAGVSQDIGANQLTLDDPEGVEGQFLRLYKVAQYMAEDRDRCERETAEYERCHTLNCQWIYSACCSAFLDPVAQSYNGNGTQHLTESLTRTMRARAMCTTTRLRPLLLNATISAPCRNAIGDNRHACRLWCSPG